MSPSTDVRPEKKSLSQNRAAAEKRSLSPITAAEFRGVLDGLAGNVVVVNLWATWCVPCLEEIPILMDVASTLADQDVALVAVAMDDPADVARVDAFRAEHFPEFMSYLRGATDMDSFVSVVDPAWNEILPTTYIIDASGKVVARLQGKKTFDDFVAAVTSAADQ
ncbi:MAG: TlpA disulfide reductase family protein [Woeseiaceae bacterium]|nr:TlpA disulfide reductase family protein [Woeseiaceae bacterium]